MSKTTQDNTFMKLFKTDVSKYTEQKGQFTYLSWTHAVAELKKICPTARHGVTKAEDGSPFFKTDCGYFVDVWVEVDGVSLSQIHPVLDNRNQSIEKPNAFQINTSLQRALAKAIALHGLGLYIFAGEDLPEPDKLTSKQIKDLLDSAKSLDEDFKQSLSNNIENGTINSRNYQKAMDRVLELNKGDKDGGSK